MAAFEQLPVELLSSITSHLPQSDILTLCCTSRGLHDTLLASLYCSVAVTSDHLLCANKVTPDARPLGHAVRIVDMVLPKITLELLELLAVTCPYITTLRFTHSNLFYLLQNLEQQKLRGTFPSADALDSTDIGMPYHKVLSELRVPDKDSTSPPFHALMTVALLQSVMNHHPQITVLDLGNVFGHIHSVEKQYLACILPRNLVDVTFNLGHGPLSPDVIEFFHEHCPRLQSLTLKARYMHPLKNYQQLTFSTNHMLKHLRLSSDCGWLNHWGWLWLIG
ncbi:hypothetical protein DM01DRAFT_1136735 [Hesseltinella vesiculosa]|uniref:F-box domain-containing protein n=1 Tax=Hesseltinella vesiculosa TaxID=101127 RepID=A0A1X2G8F7_9FUNG|nr:hypothetical protein DM01DRAFT_1136735 [Hesseltinella vesiculosa]